MARGASQIVCAKQYGELGRGQNGQPEPLSSLSSSVLCAMSVQRVVEHDASPSLVHSASCHSPSRPCTAPHSGGVRSVKFDPLPGGNSTSRNPQHFISAVVWRWHICGGTRNRDITSSSEAISRANFFLHAQANSASYSLRDGK